MNQFAHTRVYHLVPLFQEGPNHFTMRAAEASGISVQNLHAETFGFSVESFPILRNESLKPIRDIVAAIQSHQEQSSTSWLREHGRVCPKCIAGNLGARSVGWEIRFADACATHGVWLAQECECGARLKAVRSSLRQCCACSRKLGSLKAVDAPIAVVRLSQLLIDKACETPAPSQKRQRDLVRAATPADLNLADLQNLVAVLGLYGDPNAPLRRTGARKIEDLRESWQVTSLAAEAIAEWPHGFQRLLDWLRTQNDDGTPHRLGHRFGRLYRCLYQILGTSQFEFLHRELEQYLRENWPAALWRGKGRINGSRTKTRWLLASEVRSRLGISQSTLDDLIERGVLTADRRTTATGRSRLMVQRESLAVHEASAENDSVNLAVAAHVLGLGENRLRECIGQLIPRAWKTTGGVWRIPRRGLTDLLALGTSSELAMEVTSEAVVTVSAALRFLLLPTEGLISLVGELKANRAILAGRLSGLRGVASWIVSREAVHRAIVTSRPATAKFEGALTLRNLARRWKVKEEVVYALHRGGAFSAYEIEREIYRGKLVPLSEVGRFEDSFIGARELATHVRKSSRRVIAELKALQIDSSYGGDGTKCRQYFYRRSEALNSALHQLYGCGTPIPLPATERGGYTQTDREVHQ